MNNTSTLKNSTYTPTIKQASNKNKSIINNSIKNSSIKNMFNRQESNSMIEAQRPTISKRELESVLDCLIADMLSQGQITRNFERNFSNLFSFRHTLALNSLMAAYHLTFVAIDLKKDDHVIFSPFTSISVADAINIIGAKSHLVDIQPNSFHPSINSILEIERKIRKEKENENCKIVYIADHVFGSAIDFNLKELSQNNILVIEDFTGLVGSTYKEEYFGKKGVISICGLSEYDLITTGNGAVVVTSDSQLYKKLNNLRYGSERLPKSISYDYRLSDFQTAMGLVQLSNLGITLNRRKKIGQYFLENISKTKNESYFKNPEIDSYLKFPIIVNKDFDESFRYFKSLSIEVLKICELPLHHFYSLSPLEFPNAERLFRKAVCIPIYPNLTTSQIEKISKALRSLV